VPYSGSIWTGQCTGHPHPAFVLANQRATPNETVEVKSLARHRLSNAAHLRHLPPEGLAFASPKRFRPSAFFTTVGRERHNELDPRLARDMSFEVVKRVRERSRTKAAFLHRLTALFTLWAFVFTALAPSHGALSQAGERFVFPTRKDSHDHCPGDFWKGNRSLRDSVESGYVLEQ
jgi:hypothetical protein